MLLELLILCCAAVRAFAAVTPGPLRPSEAFFPSGLPRSQQLALLPGWEMQGVVLEPLESVPSSAACAEACRAALPECAFFSYCEAQGGCNASYLGQMAQGDCLLLSRNCTLPAKRSAAEGVVSGFPVHHFPGPMVEAFPTYLAQAILGADFTCPMSEVEGVCAFSSIVSAMSNCIRMGPSCLAVSYFANGTNGCSQQPLAVLKTEVPTNANSFMSPDTYTIVLTESTMAMRTVFLFADQAEVDMPSDQEILATGADAPESLAYKGCHFGNNALYRGDVVATLDGVPDAKACCHACTSYNVQAGHRACTVFNFCAQPGGCVYDSKRQDGVNVTLAQGQCELRFQPLSNALISVPPTLLDAGADVPFVAGAPNTMWAPELPGFRRMIGETIVLSGAYSCEGSLRPETTECVKGGTLQELSDYCLGSKECATMAYRLGPQPNATANGTQTNSTAASLYTIGSFKEASEVPNQVVFPTAVLYVKTSSSGSSSGLSGGAVAGIAVGAVAGAAALTAGAWVLLHRARRRRQAQQKDCEAAAAAAAAGCSGSCERSTPSVSRSSSAPGSILGHVASPPLSSTRTLTTSGDALPELVAHVAAHEAALVSQILGSPDISSQMAEWENSMLPQHLQEWVVDSSEVNYLRRADGKLWDVGSGASGKVYRVEYRGERLAAKEMELGGSQTMRETFVTEARMLHQLRHPNVVGFAGVTFHRTRGVVLMELCEGRDLHSALQVRVAGSQERLFSWRRRGKRVALDIAKAMNFLHQNNVVHMDIKSPNVLLTASGTAKLADVGFSKTKPNTYLSTVSLVGTFAWAAPELLLGSERPTSAIDVYSYGVLLHEIITGERPQRGNLRMPTDDECPEEVRALMLECLQQQPSARPTSLQVLQRLRLLVEGETKSPPPGRISIPPRPAEADPCASAPDTPDGGAGTAANTAAALPAATGTASSAPWPNMAIQLRPTLPSPFAS